MQKVVYTKQNMAKWRSSIMEWCSYLYGWQKNKNIRSFGDWLDSSILPYLAIKNSNLDNGRWCKILKSFSNEAVKFFLQKVPGLLHFGSWQKTYDLYESSCKNPTETLQ